MNGFLIINDAISKGKKPQNNFISNELGDDAIIILLATGFSVVFLLTILAIYLWR